MAYQSIKVVKGSGGFGGPLVITPTEEKHKFIYITGGGEKPEIVDKITALTGMEAVNGFKTSIPDEEIALAIVFLASEKACGINGIVLFVDGGTDALLNTEKVY